MGHHGSRRARRAARLEGASDDAALITNRSAASACPLTGTLRPLVVGALGTSLTWGADLPDQARMAISCAGACVCAPITYDAHTSKKYTYLQRTSPRWVEPAIVTSGSAASCDVIERATRLDAGRLMLKAVTMATPRAGNRSVSTSSLYALQ